MSTKKEKQEKQEPTRDEFKKVLYKEKPIATVIGRSTDLTIYQAETSLGIVEFHVPNAEALGDRGQNIIGDTPEAQLLNRWLV